MKYSIRLKVGVLALLWGMGLAAQAGAADITVQEPQTGTYDQIHRIIDANGPSENEGVHYAAGGNLIIKNGGTISITKPSSTLEGIRVTDGAKASTVQVTGGQLAINLDNRAHTGASRVQGVWVYSGYNALGGAQPTYKGSKVELHDTKIDIQTKSHALGLLAGSDFGNNSVEGGQIDSLGNLDVSVYSATSYKTVDFTNAIGLTAFGDGLINIRGKDNTIDVKSDGTGNATNTIISGLYVSKGGQITGAQDSQFNVSVTGKNIFGISAGYYDQLTENIAYQGKSGVALKGNTLISLKNEAQRTYAIGVHAAIKASVQLGSADIRFMNENAANSNWLFGLETEEEGTIDVGSLYIGAQGAVTDPTKITAILTEGKADLYKRPYDNSGTINVNQDGQGTVQVRGQVKSLDDGTVNLNLSNKDSYLYGNTRVEIYNDQGNINLSMSNGAKWINVRGDYDQDSRVTSLSLNSGAQIDMTDTTYVNEAKHGKYQSIYVDQDMTGTGGTIHMDIDATTNKDNSDRFYVKGTHTGEHYITLNNIGTGTDGAQGTVLVSVNKENGVFKANDHEGTLYWNQYTLASQKSTTAGYTTDWYLEKVTPIDPGDKPSTNVDTAESVSGLGYYGFRDMDKLMRRMGELRHNGEEEKGLWFRMRGTEYTNRKNIGYFKDRVMQYQLGYDRLKDKTDTWTRYDGIAFEYGDGDLQLRSGKGDQDMYDLSVYRTRLGNKGHYVDGVLKVGRMDQDFEVWDSNGKRITGDTEHWGAEASVEYGRKKILDENGWYIEPQSQLSLFRLFGNDYTTSSGVHVDQSGITSLVGRIGFNLGREIDERKAVYIKLNGCHEFLGDYSLRLTDTATGTSLRREGNYGDSWFEYGFGAAIRTGEDTNVYFDFERSTGGNVRKKWAWNAGIRWNF